MNTLPENEELCLVYWSREWIARTLNQRKPTHSVALTTSDKRITQDFLNQFDWEILINHQCLNDLELGHVNQLEYEQLMEYIWDILDTMI